MKTETQKIAEACGRAMESRLVCEMANKYKEETSLPMNIWIDETRSYVDGRHGKRIKFQLDKSEDFDTHNCGSMDFDGNIYPQTLQIRKLSARDLRQLRNFVRNNRRALECVADQKIRLYRIWPDMIMGGKAASAAELAALNARIDGLLAAVRNVR